MRGYEYKVIPAPRKASKIKGVRGTDFKFAASLAEIMNLYGRDGWEYQRTDTLPCEERQGLTGKTTVFQNMLVFRRIIDEPVEMSMRTPTDVTAALTRRRFEPEPEVVEAEVEAEIDGYDDVPTEPRVAPVVPAFRSTVAANAAPALALATHDAPEGRAPRIGAPSTAEPKTSVRAPSIAAQ